jgi:hypothetical protein
LIFESNIVDILNIDIMGAKIFGAKNMPPSQLIFEIEQGAKFVMYEYCFSLGVWSSKLPSNIYYVRTGEREWWRAIGFSIISLGGGLLLSPICTIKTIVNNLSGGIDVTEDVVRWRFREAWRLRELT